MASYDAIAIGIGGMGSAAVYHLARRGWTVLGLEQYDIPYEMGSSHWHSRMIRYSLEGHLSYVPLVRGPMNSATRWKTPPEKRW